jgi:hypothetical protein
LQPLPVCVCDQRCLRRSSAVMESQSKALARLRLLILGLTAFLLVFSASGFILLDVYLLSSVSETRLKFLDRTLSYFQSSIKACISLRSMHLSRNLTDPAAVHDIVIDRSIIENISNSMHDMHTLNYVSSPSQRVTDYFLKQGLPVRNTVPGAGLYEVSTANFWDLINQFISSLLMASKISTAELSNPDFSVNSLSQDKRAIVFV